MITHIGIVAGEILLHLEKFPGTTLAQLAERLELPEQSEKLLWMGLGWLIREGEVKLEVDQCGGRLYIAGQNGSGGNNLKVAKALDPKLRPVPDQSLEPEN